MAKARQLLAILTAVLFLVGCTPVLSMLFGYTFLPSPEWTSRTSLTGAAAGVAMTLLMLWIISTADSSVPHGRSGAMVGAVCFGFFIGRNVVVISGPMLFALIAGQQVERTFVVTHSDHIGAKGCHSPVGLQGLPFLFDELCGVSDEFRQQIGPGTRVVVTGLGTDIGLYANNVRRVD